MRKGLWFVAGVVVGALGLFSIAHLLNARVIHGVGSLTDNEALDWVKRGRWNVADNYILVTPRDKQNKSAALISRWLETPFPMVMFTPDGSDTDYDATGQVVVVVDASGKSVELLDADSDGIFDSYRVSTGGWSSNVTTYWDRTFSGQFDVRIAAFENVRQVQIAGHWHDLIMSNKVMYVTTPAGMKEVVRIDGELAIKE